MRKCQRGRGDKHKQSLSAPPCSCRAAAWLLRARCPSPKGHGEAGWRGAWLPGLPLLSRGPGIQQCWHYLPSPGTQPTASTCVASGRPSEANLCDWWVWAGLDLHCTASLNSHGGCLVFYLHLFLRNTYGMLLKLGSSS